MQIGTYAPLYVCKVKKDKVSLQHFNASVLSFSRKQRKTWAFYCVLEALKLKFQENKEKFADLVFFRIFVRMKQVSIALLMLIGALVLLPTRLMAIDQKPGDALKLKLQADKFFQSEQFSEALSLYTQALEAAKTTNDRPTQMSSTGNIGNVYAYMEDYDRATHYFKKGYAIAVEDKNTLAQMQFAINLVQVYCLSDNPKDARYWYKIQMSLPYKGNGVYRYYALANQSLIAKTERNYGPALYYQREALRGAEMDSIGLRYTAMIHSEIGNILSLEGKYAEAVKSLQTSLGIAVQAGDKLKEADVCRDLYVAYKQLGDSIKANQCRSRYLELNDSIFDTQRMNSAKMKLFDYENRLSDATIGRLTTHNRYLTIIIIAFLLFMIVIATLYIKLRYRNKQLLQSQQLLVDKNEELSRQNKNTQQLRRRYLAAVEKADRSEPQATHSEEPLKAQNVESETSQPTHSPDETEENSTEDIDKGSLLSDEQATRLLEKINDVFEDVSVISRDDFSLAVLAQMVGSNTKYVSMVINETYGKNFKTYLNEFRIREACRRLTDTEHYGNMTIQAIYQELGYKTAASFINAFRKVNGVTPSQYQKLSQTKADTED